jgi:hypothetical protein
MLLPVVIPPTAPAFPLPGAARMAAANNATKITFQFLVSIESEFNIAVPFKEAGLLDKPVQKFPVF